MSQAAQDQITQATDPETFTALILENAHLRVAIYPELGAKVGSILSLPGEHELLQQPLLPYATRTAEMAFDEGDASGYDECIPSVSGCELRSGGELLQVPDHGDFWRLPFAVAAANAQRVTMAAEGFSLPLLFEKTITLEGERILLGYRLTNVGGAPLEYLWSAHPGFVVDPGDRIELPRSIDTVMVQGSGGNRLGPESSRRSWPLTTTETGDATDLSLVGHPADQVGDKLFAIAPPEGWCALNRVSKGVRIEWRFDPVQAPYLGIWICYNGWPEGKSAKQFCVALEPCTAPADSLAAAIDQGHGRKLSPQSTDEWQVEVRISSSTRTTGKG